MPFRHNFFTKSKQNGIALAIGPAVVAGTAGGKSCGLSVPEIFLLLKFVQKLVLLLRVVLESVAQGARGATSASGSSAPSSYDALHFHHPVNIVTIIIVQMAAPVSLLLGSHVNVEVSSFQLLPQLLPELNDGSAHRVGLCKLQVWSQLCT